VLLLLAALGSVARLNALTNEDARFLLSRAGFDPSDPEISSLTPLDREGAIEWLLTQADANPQATAPDWSNQPIPEPPDRKALNSQDYLIARKAYDTVQGQHRDDLRRWWVGQMTTGSPLAERMVLFWHNHFTSSFDKVGEPGLMWGQDQLIRRFALGNFGDFLHAISRDPEMLLYLDTNENTKGKPNENFARELMELFTLGEGNYSETDVREAARAFTGWRIGKAHAFEENLGQHDAGPKTILGHTGTFEGDDVLDLLLKEDRTATFLTEKMWTTFVSPTPDQAEVTRIAAVFRTSGYQVRDLLRALLESPAFWAETNRSTLVKSPAELLVGFIRSTAMKTADPKRVADQMRALGQDLFNPPSVKGWPVGQAWIDSSTMLGRRRSLLDLLHTLQIERSAGLQRMIIDVSYNLE
jgi:uncharacterized protein (DUF1800 family)